MFAVDNLCAIPCTQICLEVTDTHSSLTDASLEVGTASSLCPLCQMSVLIYTYQARDASVVQVRLNLNIFFGTGSGTDIGLI